MPLTGTAITGGGARGGAALGVLQMGTLLNKWDQNDQDFFCGDSFGSFVAAGLANMWTPHQLGKIFCDTNFRRMLDPLLLAYVPWSIRKLTLPLYQGRLARLADWIDEFLDFDPDIAEDRLFVNVVDTERNQQVVYCEYAPSWLKKQPGVVILEGQFSRLGYGTILTRSMALPGLLADSPQWMDGGVSEHPPLSFIPRDSNIYLIDQGYAGQVQHGPTDTQPRNMLSRGMYAYEFKAARHQDRLIGEFPNLKRLRSKIYEVDSMDMAVSREKKKWMVATAAERSREDWHLI